MFPLFIKEKEMIFISVWTKSLLTGMVGSWATKVCTFCFYRKESNQNPVGEKTVKFSLKHYQWWHLVYRSIQYCWAYK